MTKKELEEMNELRAKYQALYEVHRETVLELRKANDDLSFHKQLVKEYEFWKMDILNNEHYKNINKLWDYKLDQYKKQNNTEEN